MMILWAMLAGGLGAVVRWILDGALSGKFRTPFSWAIPMINVSGSLLLGIIGGVAMHYSGYEALVAIVGVGFLGGFTTFSTASVDTARLVSRADGGVGLALLYAGVTLGGSLVAAALGMGLGWLL